MMSTPLILIPSTSVTNSSTADCSANHSPAYVKDALLSTFSAARRYRGEHFSEDVDYEQNPYTGEVRMVAQVKRQYWPTSKSRPKWASDLESIDADLANLFEEVHSARNAELYVLSTIGVRTVFDRATEILGIDSNMRFSEKLDELTKASRVSSAERAALDVLVEAGNAAAHRGWRPSSDEVDGLMLIMEAFLHRCFVANYLAQNLKKSVPDRKSTKP
jgi:hypothetical protein